MTGIGQVARRQVGEDDGMVREVRDRERNIRYEASGGINNDMT